MRSVKKRHMRGACLGLCVCLCALPLLEAMAGDTAAPLPTPTPLPAGDLITQSESGASGTGTPADPSVSTPEPSVTPTVTPTEVPQTSEEPTPTPVSETTEVPADTPEPTASEAPGTSPEVSATPTVSPTASELPTVVPAPTPEAGTPPAITVPPAEGGDPVWDESQCDHMNEHCERAPKCTVPGCRHIGVNEAGDVVALCGLGQWLMEVGSAPQDGIMTLAATAPIEMELVDGENILYRSGSYHLTGGGENATLYIRDNMVLSIELDGVQLLTLRVSQKSVVTIGFQGFTTIQTLTAPDAAVKLSGSGCLTVANNLNYGVLNVERGNVRLPSGASSDNGRRPVVFEAPGAEQAYVDGKFFTYVKTGSDGKVTLWLPVPGEGGSYWGRMNGNTLEVSSLAEPPAEDGKIDLSEAELFQAEAGKNYTLYATDPANQGRVIRGAAGASFTLTSAGTEGSAPTFEDGGGTLYVSGDTYLHALSGPYAVSGTGRLHVGTLSGDGLTAQGGLTIRAAGGKAPAAWTAVQVSGGDAALDLTAQYNGADLPVLFFAENPQTVYAPLPAAAAGYHYAATVQGGKLLLQAVEDEEGASVTLDASDHTFDASGNYRIVSEGGTSGKIIVADGVSVKLTLAGAYTSGDLRIGAGASVTLVLQGANAVGPVVVGDGATLSLSGTGALDAASISDGGTVSIAETTNLSLSSGTALPGSALQPTVIAVTDDQNAPMARTQIVLKLGNQEPFNVTTGRNGTVTLWRAQALSGTDVVVLSDQDTYAAVINGGAASPDALPVIRNVKATPYGSITFETDTGNTLGVQYIVSDKEEEMADTWVPTAGVALLRGGECTIPGLKDGDVVTFRAFACAQAGVTLSGDTASAFAFSEKVVFTVKEERQPLVIADQERTYNGKAFQLNKKLYPESATVSYFQDGELMQRAPVKVGEYIARVTVPAGDAQYLPGSYDVRMTIKRIVVLIYPEAASKQKGQEDPDFFYEYDESVMLEDDEVTGSLSRVQGETYGNYPYLAGSLSAPDYYELVIAPDSPLFFIDWNIHHYLPYDPLARIDPVYDELRFSSGKTLRTQIRTIDVLKVGDTYYGTPVTDLIDGRERPATPTLRLRGGYDSALLILNAEPELNADGGYATDLDGNKLVRGRRLTISYSMLNNLGRQNVDYIAFGLDGVMAMVDLEELRSSEAVADLLKQEGISKSSATRFQIDLEPVTADTQLAQSEAGAQEAAQLGEKLMRVSVKVSSGSRRVDIAPVLKNASVLFDASGLLESDLAVTQTGDDVTETVAGKPVTSGTDGQDQRMQAAVAAAKGEAEADEELLDLTLEMLNEHIRMNDTTLLRYDGGEKKLDTTAVVPYTASESNRAMFRAVMRTRPYLTAQLSKSGLYGLGEQSGN